MGAAAFLLAQGVVCRAGPLLLYEYTTQFKCHNITRVGESPPGCDAAELRRARLPRLVVRSSTATRARDPVADTRVATLGSRVPDTLRVTPAARPRSARLSAVSF